MKIGKDNIASENATGLMSFGEHLEVFRKMLFRIIGVVAILGIGIFCAKETTFRLLLAPSNSEFWTYRAIEKLACNTTNINFQFDPYRIQFINTELSNQFITHVSTSFYLALLFASPYVIWELYRFIAPALYVSEKKYSLKVALSIFILFILGVLMSYYVLLPFAFRFLSTYQVSDEVVNQINLSSYISTFVTLTLLMGLVFQIPILSFFLAKMRLLTANFMRHYRRHAVIAIAIIAAIITPPDLFTCFMVILPMYGLYELSILIVSVVNRA